MLNVIPSLNWLNSHLDFFLNHSRFLVSVSNWTLFSVFASSVLVNILYLFCKTFLLVFDLMSQTLYYYIVLIKFGFWQYNKDYELCVLFYLIRRIFKVLFDFKSIIFWKIKNYFKFLCNLFYNIYSEAYARLCVS